MNIQEMPKYHSSIPELIYSPHDGSLIDQNSLADSDRDSVIERRPIATDYDGPSIKRSLHVIKRESNRSIDMLNRRPVNSSVHKSNRSLSKHSVKTVSRHTSKQTSKDMYYPGTNLVPVKSQKSEPMRKQNVAKRDRTLSLPDIKRGSIKHQHSVSSHYTNNKLQSDTSFSGKNLKYPKNREVGQSFVSFNAKNSSIKPNSLKASITPGTTGKSGKAHNVSLNYTDKLSKNVRESFESCTTEGKKTSQVAIDLNSSNRVAEDNYGIQKPSEINTSQYKQSSKENIQVDRSKSKLSNIRSETIGEDSLPEIANSVVEDSLPFKGLENHYKAISKEGFSGANDTNYMQKTNENFYSSFKTNNRGDGSPPKKRPGIENGLPSLNGQELNPTDQYYQSAAYEDSDDLDRDGARAWNGQKSIDTSSHQKNSMYNVMKASSTNKNTITVNKNSKNSRIAHHRKNNKSKVSSHNDEQWFSYDAGHNAKIGKTAKIKSKKVDSLDGGKLHTLIFHLEMERLEQNESIFNEGETLRNGLIDVNKTYDHVKQHKKKKQKPTPQATSGKWGDVMQFLEKNPNVLMNMIPDENINTELSTDRNRQAVANYRSITGISAPGRGKKHTSQKNSDLIAPWKMNKKSKVNRDFKKQVDQRSYNISSKRKQALPTNAGSNGSQTDIAKTQSKQKIKIPHISNRDGLNSQPARTLGNFQKTLESRNPKPKPNVHTAKNGGFKMYKTPSFVSPQESSVSNIKGSYSQSTYSKSSSLQEANNGSSMLEKHTIIIESDTEYADNYSEAPTESQRMQIERKQTITIDSSERSYKPGPKEYILIETDRRDSSKVDSEKPKEFNPTTGNLATFRDNKMKSQSDIYHDDVDLDEYNNEARAAKTALNQSRIAANISKITVNHVRQADEIERASKSGSHSNPKYNKQFVDENIQTRLDGQDLSPSEKERMNDEIYLNTNSAEENPDLVDYIIKDSNSVSKRTLFVDSNTEYENEGESYHSEKERQKPKPIKVDRNIQISPTTAPKQFVEKNIQISVTDAASKLNKSIPLQDGSQFNDGQSEYINREMSKLQNNQNRRERFQSNKDLRMMKRISHDPKDNNRKPAETRYAKNKPFGYAPNADNMSQISEEKKLPERVTYTRARPRADTQDRVLPDFGVENRSVEYRPIITPPHYSVGLQPSNRDKSAGIQYSEHGVSAGVQYSLPEKSAGVQYSIKDDKSAGIQYSNFDKSAGIQASIRDKSQGVQYSQEFDKSQGVQPSRDFDRSAGVQHSQEFDKSQGIQCSYDGGRSIGLQRSQDFDRSAGMQVGDSLASSSEYVSMYNRSAQFDEPLFNVGVQADEAPYKDLDIQCDMSENDKGIQAEAKLINRGQSASTNSLRNLLMARDLEIVDKSSVQSRGINDNQIDFSCQFSYHTIASTAHEKDADCKF